jgi:hypothetical protein
MLKMGRGYNSIWLPSSAEVIMDKRCQNRHFCGLSNQAVQHAAGGASPCSESNKLRRLLRISAWPTQNVRVMSLYHEIQAISLSAWFKMAPHKLLRAGNSWLSNCKLVNCYHNKQLSSALKCWTALTVFLIPRISSPCKQNRETGPPSWVDSAQPSDPSLIHIKIYLTGELYQAAGRIAQSV